MLDVHEKEQEWGCDRCPADFSRWANLKRHLDNETAHWDWWECQFCHDDDLWFKSKTEARKHFLFSPRTRSDDKRSWSAYSCVNNERKKREDKEKARKELHKEVVERVAKWDRYWKELSGEEKERERKEYREETIQRWRAELDLWEKPDKYKEARLKKLTDNFDKGQNDSTMITVMRKKYGNEFRNNLSRQLGEEQMKRLAEASGQQNVGTVKSKVVKAKPVKPFSATCCVCKKVFDDEDQFNKHCGWFGPGDEECNRIFKLSQKQKEKDNSS